jgi:hypothetical protein
MSVASVFYGNSSVSNYHGAASGVTNIQIYDAAWFGNNIIGTGSNIAARVINQSFLYLGYSATTDAYYDRYISQYNKIIVIGAGNHSTYGALTSSVATFYNGITVGASDTLRGLGPTWNGRSKPDLIAPSIAQVGAATNVNVFQSAQPGTDGTSISAPLVAGAAAVLVDVALGTPALANGTNALVVKSVLMTSAKKLDGWTRGTNGVANPSAIPLDWRQGAGLLQVKSAYDLLSAGEQAYGTGNVLSNGWDFASVGGTLQNRTRTYNLFLSNSVFLNTNFSITATLNWYENVAANYSTSLQNLDLKLKYNGTYLQYCTSIVDNVEHLWFTTNAPGIYTLEVTAANTATPYALSWTAVAVPEPSTVILLGAVLGAALLTQRARRER